MSPAEQNPAEEVDPAFAALVEAFSDAVERGRMDDAAAASSAVMQEAFERAQANPDPELLRAMIAHRAEADREWDVARKIYSEDLEAATRSVGDRARFLLRSHAYHQLARVESYSGNEEAALELARCAVEAVREGDSEMSLAMALESYAGYASHLQRGEMALAAADEGLSILPDNRSYGVIRSQLLLRRAEALLMADRLEDARDSVTKAWAAIEPLSPMVGAAGVQWTIACGWRIDAKVRDKEKRPWPAVRDAWENSVVRHRHVIHLWQDDGWVYFRALAETLAGYAVSAEKAGESERASELRAESRRLAELRSRPQEASSIRAALCWHDSHR